MKKFARFFLMLIVLSGIATAFADVGGHTKPSGGCQDSDYLCQLTSYSEVATSLMICADF